MKSKSPYVFRLAASLLLCAAALLPVSAQKLLIYRNDNNFNMVELKHNPQMEHKVEGLTADKLTLSADGLSETIDIPAIDSCVVRHTDIPTLSFTFNDYPDRYQVWDKENYLSATLDVDGNGTTDDASGLEVSVRGRGNSTFSFAKKPMRLKFASKTALCGFAKAKNFVLLANYIDPNHMRNALTMWVARQMSSKWANHTMPCNVVINGRHQGLYLLTEKIGINKTSVDINEEQGMLFELSTEYDEKYKFISRYFSLPVMVKDPDLDEIYGEKGISPDDVLAAWQNDFNDALAEVLRGRPWTRFDLDSFVNYVIVANFANNDEIGYPKSVYISKASLGAGTPYVFGPVWDYDVAYNHLRTAAGGEADEKEAYKNTWFNSLFSHLMTSSDFRARYAERFEYFYDEVVPQMWQFFDSYAELIEPSVINDGVLWSEEIKLSWLFRRPSYNAKAEAAALRSWAERRIDFMKQQVDRGVEL